MVIDNQLLKFVVFMGVHDPETGQSAICGSGFVYGHDCGNGNAEPCYVVTAKHVIENIRKKGANHIWYRVNTKDGESRWISTPWSSWQFSTDQTVDAAVTIARFSDDMDLSVCPDSWSLPKAKPQGESLLLGDEVFVTGYFSKHCGNDRNVPIVRIGNLACTTVEEIRTKAFGTTKGYLIECRSIGGLSGSPVFLHQGGKFIGNSITTGGHPLLIGLIHGHFDDELGADVADDAVSDGKKVNTGIAVVTPISKVHEFVHLAPIQPTISIQSVGSEPRLQFTGEPIASMVSPSRLGPG